MNMNTGGTATKRAYRCVVVNIRRGNPGPAVDLDPVEVSKGRQDEVVWQCDADFEVIFDPNDCPFKDNRFNKGKNHSGSAKPDAKEKPHIYKYTVKAFGETLDPGTIVNQ